MRYSRARWSRYIVVSYYPGVDIYGACGPHECSRSQGKRCGELLDRDYFFYLSFENANCKDYITEKFFNALKYVPFAGSRSS
ncbi:hypothetical protein HPB51_021122 [Rhipicephalus microplus]|uniref:Fucosyltransferase n=1 Tax=Rhipicephalus microplus TaxID=6941 RepID=A0A9J6DWU6_RHIMP|nr:hypothetical protein HPB51_021122 [Rhipicephalus microplus]